MHVDVDGNQLQFCSHLGIPLLLTRAYFSSSGCESLTLIALYMFQ